MRTTKWKDKLPGGLADKKKPSDFDPKALAKGKKVEMEHTDDPATAQEVAMDHLTEDPDYYDKLETIEKHGKEKAMTLREATIKLAQENPELRKHLVPLLRKTAGDKAKTEEGAKKLYEQYKEKHPNTKKTPKDFFEKSEKDDKGKEKGKKEVGDAPYGKDPLPKSPWEGKKPLQKAEEVLGDLRGTEIGGEGGDRSIDPTINALNKFVNDTFSGGWDGAPDVFENIWEAYSSGAIDHQQASDLQNLIDNHWDMLKDEMGEEEEPKPEKKPEKKDEGKKPSGGSFGEIKDLLGKWEKQREKGDSSGSAKGSIQEASKLVESITDKALGGATPSKDDFKGAEKLWTALSDAHGELKNSIMFVDSDDKIKKKLKNLEDAAAAAKKHLQGDKKDEGKKDEEKPKRSVADVKKELDLTDDDEKEVGAFKKKLKNYKKMTDAQLMQKFMREAKPETKERMKGMSVADFMIMFKSIMDEEEGGEGGKQAMSTPLRDAVTKLAHDVPEMRQFLVPILRRTAHMGCGDEQTAGREHGEPGKGYGMTGPDVRGKGKWAPEAKGECYYETGDEADRCYVTQKGGPGGQKKPGPSTRTWKEYEDQRW